MNKILFAFILAVVLVSFALITFTNVSANYECAGCGDKIKSAWENEYVDYDAMYEITPIPQMFTWTGSMCMWNQMGYAVDKSMCGVDDK